MSAINWTDVLSSVLPTVVILGAGWLRTHGKVTEILHLLRSVVDQTDNTASTTNANPPVVPPAAIPPQSGN